MKRILTNKHSQTKLWQSISIYLLVLLMSISFAFGQTKDEGKLELVVQTGHTGSVGSVVFSPDGKILASVSNFPTASKSIVTIKIWDVASYRELRTITSENEGVESLVFSQDGKTLASIDRDESVELWEIETGKKIKYEQLPVWIHSENTSPNRKKAIHGNSSEKTTELWDEGANQKINTLLNCIDCRRSTAFSVDSKILAIGTEDEVKLWNTETGKELITLKTEEVWTESLAFSPNSKILAIGKKDTTIDFWNIETGEIVKTLSGHTDSVSSLTFSPNGNLLASGGWDEKVKLWDIETGQELNSFSNSAWILGVSAQKGGEIPYGTIMLSNSETGRTNKYELLSDWLDLSGNFILTNKIIGNIVQGRIEDGRQIKFYDFINEKKGKEICRFIVIDENDWVVITPDGRFDASDGALKLMHYSYG